MRRRGIALAAAAAMGSAAFVAPPSASADVGVYLLNVTVRPVYHFANADQALAYGHGLCDKIANGVSYAENVRDIWADFNTSDEFSASYLMSQATQELCPEQIPQLRRSAAGYRPQPPPA